MKINSDTVIKKVQRLENLQMESMSSVVRGDYKGYRKAHQEYVSTALKDFDLLKETHKPKITVPLFSKYGFNMVKIWFLNLFHIKSAEEKLFDKKVADEFVRQNCVK